MLESRRASDKQRRPPNSGKFGADAAKDGARGGVGGREDSRGSQCPANILTSGPRAGLGHSLTDRGQLMQVSTR